MRVGSFNVKKSLKKNHKLKLFVHTKRKNRNVVVRAHAQQWNVIDDTFLL